MYNFMHKLLPYISSKKFYKTYNLLRKYEMFVITQNVLSCYATRSRDYSLQVTSDTQR